jgi:hypothetical protein
MSVLQIANGAITVFNYLICLFFLAAIIRVFLKAKKLQDALVYCVIMIPFVLRLLRLK